MKVSVIIAVYNEEKHLKQCLESLAKQSLKNFEIIVVDDGSVDQTWQVLSAIQSSKPKIQKFKQKHQGPALARNYAARQAKGEILVFVDGDMYFDQDLVLSTHHIVAPAALFEIANNSPKCQKYHTQQLLH